jgi:hypothetical protein
VIILVPQPCTDSLNGSFVSNTCGYYCDTVFQPINRYLFYGYYVSTLPVLGSSTQLGSDMVIEKCTMFDIIPYNSYFTQCIIGSEYQLGQDAKLYNCSNPPLTSFVTSPCKPGVLTTGKIDPQ